MNWGPEKMLIRCSKESQHPAEWTPGLRLSIRRTRKTQRDGHKSEGQNIAVSVRSPALSLKCNPWVTLLYLCNKVRGKYFVKEVFQRLYHCVGMYPVYMCIFLHESADENTTPYPWYEYGYSKWTSNVRNLYIDRHITQESWNTKNTYDF